MLTESEWGAPVSLRMSSLTAVIASSGGIGVKLPTRLHICVIHESLCLHASCCFANNARILSPNFIPKSATDLSLSTEAVALRSPPTAACSTRALSSVVGNPRSGWEKVIVSSMLGITARVTDAGSDVEDEEEDVERGCEAVTELNFVQEGINFAAR